MPESLQFETPENVQVQYEPAGLGTRFLGWFIDQVIVTLLLFILVIVLAVIGVSFAGSLEDLLDEDTADPEQIAAYVIGILVLITGFGSFFYFTLSELFWRGQTLGKRMVRIRVVKGNGFALDPAGILIRNLFRVADNIPLLWIVPVLSKRSQRTGDMVAGTLVISDERPEMTDARVELSERSAAEAEFRFDSRSLQKLQEKDFDVIERLLDRWVKVPPDQRRDLLERLTQSLATKMGVEQPAVEKRQRFLEDLFAAELRRQGRLLN